MSDTNNTIEVLEAFNVDTLDVDVKLKLPEIESNFDIFKQQLEKKLEKFDFIVNEDSVKDANKTATGLNKISSKIAEAKKTNVDKLMGPINAFKSNCDQLITLVQDKRQGLLTQVKVFEDKERALVTRFLHEDLEKFYDKFGINAEFQTVKIDDLAIISNKAKLGLTLKAKGQLEARVLECKRLQEKIELRLVTLEGTCLKMGLEAPLVRKNIEAFLKEADDSKYEATLKSLILSEIERFAQMTIKIEQKAQQEAEANAKAQLAARPQPKIVVETVIQTPTSPTTSTIQQTPQNIPQKTSSVVLTGNKKKYIVTAVFEVEIDEAYEQPRIKECLLKKFVQAGITNIPEITIAKKREVSEDNVPSGPQKEGSLF